MSVNRDLPHVLVLPEDDANRSLATGFWLQIAANRQRQMDVRRVAGGWNNVLDVFNEDYVRDMERYFTRYMVLLIDFDGHEGRLQQAQNRVPQHLADRVFVLGTLTKPEKLKAAGLGAYEKIGENLARDCHENTNEAWGHELLQHNAGELARLRQHVLPILFPAI
jgi:hypothetical protein